MSRFEHSPEGVARIREFTEGFISAFELFEHSEPQASTIVSFAKHCTTSQFCGLPMEAACIYLSLVLYVDDEDEGSRNTDRDACFRRFQEILDGSRMVETLADQALIELVFRCEMLAKTRGMSAKQFKSRTMAMFRAQHHERSLVASGGVHDLRSFHAVRPRTIANDPWISLLKLVEDVDEMRLGPMVKARFRVLEELTNRFIFLLNDLFSAHREADDPSALNLVCVLNRMGMPWRSSLESAWELHDKGVDSFLRIKNEIVEESLPELRAEILRYLSLLEINITGNQAAIAEIGSRYREPL
jgi:hypothetical protein